MEDTSQTVLDLEACARIMRPALEEGLATEVIVWALYAMQQDPTLTVEQALDHGFFEWIK